MSESLVIDEANLVGKGARKRGLRIRSGPGRTRALARAKKLVLSGASLEEAAMAVGFAARSLERIAREDHWLEQRADLKVATLASVGLDWPTERERYRARAYQLGVKWLDILEGLPADEIHKAVATFATLDRAMRALVGLGDGQSPGGLTIVSPAVSILSTPS